MASCIPRSMFHRHTMEEWEDLVNRKSGLMGLHTLTPNKARSLYNSYLRELPFYGSTVFSVKDSASKEDCFLAVNVYGAHIIDYMTKDIRHSFTLTQFEKWEYTNSTLSLSLLSKYINPTSQLLLPTKFIFSTSQGIEIVHLLEKYSHIMKAFPYPFVLIVPYSDSIPPLESVKVGDVVRVVSRPNINNDLVTVLDGTKKQVTIPLAVCLPCIDPALSIQQAGNFVDMPPTRGGLMSPATSRLQIRDFNTSLMAINILPSVEMLPFSDFVENHFRKNSKHRDKRGVFSKDKIDNSLLELPVPLASKAVKIFSQILKYCQLQTTRTFDPRTLAQNVVEIMLKEPALRDEVYCQLMKQTILNPKKVACRKAWELIAIAIGCVSPTTSLLDYLIAYLQDSALLDTEYKQLVQQAQARMANTLSAPLRTLGPTFYEIDCVVNCVPIYCEVVTADDVVHKIPISVNTSVRELLEKMSEKLHLPFHYLQGYHLFARVADSNSLFQNNYTRFGTYSSLKLDQSVLDVWKVLDTFYNRIQDKKQKEYLAPAPGTVNPFKLYRKVMVGLSQVPENHILANLEACQGAKDLFSGKYPATPAEATNFAALYLQFTHRDYNPNQPVVDVKNVRSFVAPYIFESSGLNNAQWSEALNIAYASLAGKSAHDARVQFLHDLRNWPIYGGTLFLVHVGDPPSANATQSITAGPTLTNPEHINPADNTSSNLVWVAFHKNGIEVLSYPDFVRRQWPKYNFRKVAMLIYTG
eukprot:Phypoly_transcript_03513.p1 GENE.Phypoly_transcript_03513~~Phypoly_transcript_03513.p1  ORF type:complete len:765 (+),score=74.87 Phypoly_transcript_03513:38-2296(+)